MKNKRRSNLGIIKNTFSYVKYLTLSEREEKTEVNISLVQEKYWFQELVITQPSILKVIDDDKEIRQYF